MRNSHVIPEFLYAPLYNERHQFNILTTIESESNSFAQKGIREPLLCDECEKKIGIFERHASLVFNGRLKDLEIRQIGSLIFLEGIDYKKFKLFLLSITWRASIRRPPDFE